MYQNTFANIETPFFRNILSSCYRNMKFEEFWQSLLNHNSQVSNYNLWEIMDKIQSEIEFLSSQYEFPNSNQAEETSGAHQWKF